jgi:hypothetical protein
MEPMVPVWLTRRARLENKRSRLEQWLQLILSRARKGGNRLLQSAIERFLSVADKFPDADSEALLALNSVTSLVVINAGVNVESILLKLSADVNHLLTPTGKRILNLAQQGPNTSLPTIMDLSIEQLPKSISFDLSLTCPTVRLCLRNTSKMPCLFKTM